jgi:uncharacterized protein YbaR (Trm112 family)/SAM-dependent methyltransferase
MSLYDLLCCPRCKAPVRRDGVELECEQCLQRYPIVNGTPVLFPDGKLPEIQHESELVSLPLYYPWIHRLVMQSLLDDQVVIEIGAGNVAVNDPCVIRTDVKLTPHTDVVCDAHFLPFRDQSADFIFSLAVVEHLRQPFTAAQEIRRVLKDGGYAYHECNFVFAYHGYPHHYFNASIQGMEQIFSDFTAIRKGVAPYQMPSFAVQMVLLTYLRHSTISQDAGAHRFHRMIEDLLSEELVDYDRYFTEADAAYVAAGSYFFGMRQDTPDSSSIPEVIRSAWRGSPGLQERFPKMYDLGTAKNILLWAKSEGRETVPEIATFLGGIQPFQKQPGGTQTRDSTPHLPVVEPKFGTLWDFPECAPPRKRSGLPEPLQRPVSPRFMDRLATLFELLARRIRTRS